MRKKYHVKKGDKVVVNCGVWKNEEAKIKAILSEKDRVVLELTNMTPEKEQKLGKKVSKNADAPKGILIERSVSVHVSNVNKVE